MTEAKNAPGLAARRVAYRVLRDTRERDAYANLVLGHRIAEAGLRGRDAAFATELTAGTLRMRGKYDYIIASLAGRDTAKIDADVLDILRIGAHQILNMRVANHAAVFETVRLAKREGLGRAAGFVNAVLRRLSSRDLQQWDDEIGNARLSTSERRAILYSHPEWIIEAFAEALRAEGREEELSRLLSVDNEGPAVSLVNLDAANDPRLESAESATRAGLSPLGWELHGGNPAQEIAELGVSEGSFRVQDQGSQLAALALTRIRPARDGERWLDLCAGPGGKSAVLASEAQPHGIKLRANEVSEHRAGLVSQAVAAFRDGVEVVSFDGRDGQAFGGQRYERILVDAPCSGIGALRRRPEARWRKSPEDVAELTRLQGELLAGAAANLADDGVIAYVTCSPHLAETREIVDGFLSSHPDFEELDARLVLQDVSRERLDLGDGDALHAQLWPHRHGTDAMFIALLSKK